MFTEVLGIPLDTPMYMVLLGQHKDVDSKRFQPTKIYLSYFNITSDPSTDKITPVMGLDVTPASDNLIERTGLETFGSFPVARTFFRSTNCLYRMILLPTMKKIHLIQLPNGNKPPRVLT